MLKKIIEACSTTARTTIRRSAFPSDHRPRQADSEECSRAQARSIAEQPRAPLCDHTDANRRYGTPNAGRITVFRTLAVLLVGTPQVDPIETPMVADPG